MFLFSLFYYASFMHLFLCSALLLTMGRPSGNLYPAIPVGLGQGRGGGVVVPGSLGPLYCYILCHKYICIYVYIYMKKMPTFLGGILLLFSLCLFCFNWWGYSVPCPFPSFLASYNSY
jgi:hypothetical protein